MSAVGLILLQALWVSAFGLPDGIFAAPEAEKDASALQAVQSLLKRFDVATRLSFAGPGALHTFRSWALAFLFALTFGFIGCPTVFAVWKCFACIASS